MPEEIVSDGDIIDIVVDLVLEGLEIHDYGDLVDVGDRVDVGDLPFDQQLEALSTNPVVREAAARRISEAQAEGRAFPLPTARDIAAARERARARQHKS